MHNEPQPRANARPCSTPAQIAGGSPRSVPPAWLAAPDGGPPAMTGETIVAAVLADPDLLEQVLRRAAPARHCQARSDGWSGERIATFLEVLADTGIVAEACRVVGMSRESAYEARNRDPVFDAAWRAAKAKARPLIADGLLERSITGTVEHYYRDGVLVGERRHYESWLGLAVLKRLDQQAEEDRAQRSLSARIAGDWQATLGAFRAGGSDAVPALLDAQVDEVDTPPSPLRAEWEDEDEADHVVDRIWQDDDGCWLTDFPPPAGFEGFQSCAYGEDDYERACTPEELGLIEAQVAVENAEDLAEDERARDAFFADLRRQLGRSSAPTNDPSPKDDCGPQTPPVEPSA